MNLNRLTERSQEALREAQGLATRAGNQGVDVEHLLLGAAPAARRHRRRPAAGRRRRSEPPCKAACSRRWSRLPQGQRPGGAAGSGLRHPAPQPAADQGRGRGDGAQGRLRQRRAPAARHRSTTAAPPAGSCASTGVTRDALMAALQKVRGNQRVTSQNPEATYQALEKYGRDLTKLAAPGQARSGHRPRRGDPPRHPGPVAPHQEQPGADRRAGRRQDGHRRGSGAAHRPRRRARGPEGQDASSPSTWAR